MVRAIAGKMMYQRVRSSSDALIMNCVSFGRLPLNCL